jgi:hypothetical protein
LTDSTTRAQKALYDKNVIFLCLSCNFIFLDSQYLITEINRRQVESSTGMEEKSQIGVHAPTTNQKAQAGGRNQSRMERKQEEHGRFVLSANSQFNNEN